MLKRYFRSEPAFIAWRSVPALLVGFLLLAAPLWAQTTLPPVTIGAGLRTGYVHTGPLSGSSAAKSDQFLINSARIYVNGSATPDIKFMFNTEYEGATDKIGVLDAVARFEKSPSFNIWAGRFIAPSDRANLYGPYYAPHWNVYTDGVQDGYPSVLNGGSPTGRDNGIAYWGDFAKKVKVSLGAFDGASLTGNPKVMTAARVQIDFWDPEGGYYLNGTYYGDKNLLAIGGATEVQSGNAASNIDFLMEKKLPDGGVVSIESEWADYNKLGGYDGGYRNSQGAYILGSYLFPKAIGMGKIEVLGKYGKAQFTKGLGGAATPNYTWKTTEINVNYVIKQFNARVMSFYKDTRFNVTSKPNSWQGGVGLQIQM
jgi:hypothetical protein